MKNVPSGIDPTSLAEWPLDGRRFERDLAPVGDEAEPNARGDVNLVGVISASVKHEGREKQEHYINKRNFARFQERREKTK